MTTRETIQFNKDYKDVLKQRKNEKMRIKEDEAYNKKYAIMRKKEIALKKKKLQKEQKEREKKIKKIDNELKKQKKMFDNLSKQIQKKKNDIEYKQQKREMIASDKESEKQQKQFDKLSKQIRPKRVTINESRNMTSFTPKNEEYKHTRVPRKTSKYKNGVLLEEYRKKKEKPINKIPDMTEYAKRKPRKTSKYKDKYGNLKKKVTIDESRNMTSVI